MHGQYDPFDLQAWVGRAAHQRDGAHQLPQPFQRIIFALDRDQQCVGGRQRVDGQQAERRRAIDQKKIVVAQRRLDRFAQQMLPVGHGDQLDLRADQVDRRRQDAQMGQLRRLNDLVDRLLSHEQIVGRPFDAAAVDADAAGGVALRIDVEEQHTLFGGGERGGQIDRRRCFADAALLIGNGDDFSHQIART